jgi:HD-like signal output (HDOD) protein
MTSMGGIERFFLSSTNLPTMPEPARLVVAGFDDPAVDLAALARIAAGDEELSRRIVGSAAKLRPGPGDPADAFAAADRLGLARLREHLLVASISSAFARIEPLDRVPFWTHAMATAGYARALAGALALDPESAYLAGLLQRSGELLLARMLPELVAGIEKSARAPGERARRELQAIGYTHADLSAELARRWRFPQRLIDGLARSADPLAQPFTPLAAVLDLSETLADALLLGLEPAQAAAAAREPLLRRLQADVHWLRARLPDAETLAMGVEALVG